MAEKKKASPLSIAVPNLPLRETSETEEARRRYEEALQNVLATVEKRKNRLIEPGWAAIASGFSNLPNFSEGYESARREFQAEDELLAQQKLALAQAQLEMSGQRARMGRMRERFGIPSGASQAPGAPAPSMPAVTGAPAPGAPMAPAPAYKPDPSGLPGAISFEEFAEVAMDNGIFDETEIRDRWAKYSEKMRTTTGGTTRVPGAAPIVDITAIQKKYIPELGGNAEISISDAMEYENSYGDPARRARIVDKIRGDMPRAAAASTAPSGASKFKTVEELAAEAAGAKTRAEGTATSDLKRIEEFAANADNAGSAIMIANMVKEIASSPNARNFIGVYSRPGVAEALKRAVVDAAGNVLGLPEIREILTNAGLTKPEVDQNQRLVFFAVNTQLETAKLLKGAVSDFETKLVGKAGYSPDTSPETLQFQADYVVLRKTFDQDAYNAFSEGRDQGKWTTLDQFKRNPVYKNMKKQFEGDLMKLAEGKRLRVSSSDRPAKPATRPTPKSSSKASDEGLDVPDQVPAGVVINRRPL